MQKTQQVRRSRHPRKSGWFFSLLVIFIFSGLSYSMPHMEGPLSESVIDTALLPSYGQVVALQPEEKFGNLEGTWIGQGYQHDVHAVWDLKLICKNGRYQIEYPGIGCGGKWQLAEKKAGSLLFREKITSGKEQCYNNGFIMIEPIVGGLLRFSFYYPNLNSLNAVGFLARQ